ncbi:anhydro-N-acetylmuramic acid kinase [Vibrio sp. 10N.286.49.B3]|uniref:anhydro-N-acetylmuramic acid kinase n=1 Tax=Vibrio sp. 10N.286.49.B3 TaxID=1880855 RepID=UPI000C861F27|nr:anhydro-N-acetylmuramic acid kinase [Vibrio sp. 10N.286.49.B3]PMH39726.1 anhydro-N-acetylmuramic acid kinase [Vibrio sp. 10N.286.49.B3]
MTGKELYIGVMSGTSLDGVDTVLVSINKGDLTGSSIRLIAHNEFALPDDLKQGLLGICLGQATDLVTIGQLDHRLGHLFADAVNALLDKQQLKAEQITAIGNHGQTVFHQPNSAMPFTIQLGDANIIAAKTDIDTVADFRRKDMALGGQGAPLVPAFHHTIFTPKDSTIVVLNIGGIANLSVLRPNQTVIGYDTGPGNMLMDAWVNLHKGWKYDKNAAYAQLGKVNDALLSLLMAEEYFQLCAPKSTGRELFNLPWLEEKLALFNQQNQNLTAEDIQATLTEFSAVTIANEVAQYQQGPQPELLVCGGGAHNPLLMKKLTQHLPDWQVASTSQRGVDSDNMEAMAFAWLAQRRIYGLTSNLPEVTGAKKLASLGVIYPAN